MTSSTTTTDPYQASCLDQHTTPYTADVVECYPCVDRKGTDDIDLDQFAIIAATYQLNEKTQTRVGSIQRWNAPDTSNISHTESKDSFITLEKTIDHLDTTFGHLNTVNDRASKCDHVDLSGIFDAKWSNLNNQAHLATAHADGMIHLWDRTLTNVSHTQVTSDTTDMVLSVDWSNRAGSNSTKLKSSEPTRIASSDTSGTIHISDISDALGLSPILDISAHTLKIAPSVTVPSEAWIVAFDYSSAGNVVWSGGDDGLLHTWDIRASPSRPTHTCRVHEGGVCSLHNHPHKDHIWASGSYDNKLRVWDDRQMVEPLNHIDCGGGVWRVKWYPDAGCFEDTIITASMRGGAHIFSYDTDSQEIQRICTYQGHNETSQAANVECLVYGIDFIPGTLPTRQSSRKDTLDGVCLATASFYDKSLHFWQLSHPDTSI